MPPKHCSSVDFPEPLGPVTAYDLDVSNSRSAFLNIHSRLKRLPALDSLILIHFVFRKALDDADLRVLNELQDLRFDLTVRNFIPDQVDPGSSAVVAHKKH